MPKRAILKTTSYVAREIGDRTHQIMDIDVEADFGRYSSETITFGDRNIHRFYVRGTSILVAEYKDMSYTEAQEEFARYLEELVGIH